MSGLWLGLLFRPLSRLRSLKHFRNSLTAGNSQRSHRSRSSGYMEIRATSQRPKARKAVSQPGHQLSIIPMPQCVSSLIRTMPISSLRTKCRGCCGHAAEPRHHGTISSRWRDSTIRGQGCILLSFQGEGPKMRPQKRKVHFL